MTPKGLAAAAPPCLQTPGREKKTSPHPLPCAPHTPGGGERGGRQHPKSPPIPPASPLPFLVTALFIFIYLCGDGLELDCRRSERSRRGAGKVSGIVVLSPKIQGW